MTEELKGGEPQPGGETKVAARPDDIPEKFWDSETGEFRTQQFVKSYGEMEKKLSTKAAPGTGVAISTEEEELSDDAGLDAVVLKAGLDPQKVGEEFRKEGKLTERMYEAFKKIHYNKGVVNEVLKTKLILAQSQADALRAAATQKVGGEEQLNNLLEWGKTNLTKPELASYNKLISNPETATVGLEWLVAKHKDAVGAGNATALIEGTVSAGAAVGAFKSQDELTTAMGDDRYAPGTAKFDQAYYDEVRRRLVVTDMDALAGIRK